MSDLLTNGTHAIYQGSHEEHHEARVRVLGHHPALNGDGTTRYIIAVLNVHGNPIQTLSNTRRESLR